MQMKRERTGNKLIAMLLAAVLLAAMLTGCASGAENAVKADLESMRSSDHDPETAEEISEMLSDQGREYYDQFISRTGEFEYKITGHDKVSASDDGETAGERTVVHVRITTYDFASEYLKTWSEFLEKSDGSAGEYDSAELYEMLFENLAKTEDRDYTADVDIVCTQDEDGEWHTDATSNRALRDAIYGGMLIEMGMLAGM